jgi:hypothetical protein
MVKGKGADMKRILFFIVIIILLACLSVGWAQVVYYANQTTIAWDAVTKYQDGTILPAGTIVSYEIYLKDGTQTLLGLTTATQFTVTLTDYLIHDVGVRASITVGETKYFSEVAWSSVEGISPFVVQRYPAPAKVQNLRVE